MRSQRETVLFLTLVICSITTGIAASRLDDGVAVITADAAAQGATGQPPAHALHPVAWLLPTLMRLGACFVNNMAPGKQPLSMTSVSAGTGGVGTTSVVGGRGSKDQGIAPWRGAAASITAPRRVLLQRGGQVSKGADNRIAFNRNDGIGEWQAGANSS
jgi:hypothetical protein